MDSTKLLIKWSLASQDLLAVSSTGAGVQIYSGGRVSSLRPSTPENDVTCLDFAQNCDTGRLVCGTEAGNLVLFQGEKWETSSLSTSRRPVRFVAWDPIGDFRIAVGHQTARGEPGLSLVDASAWTEHTEGNGQRLDTHSMFYSEGAVDGSYLRPNVLAVGFLSRYLRVLDLRTSEHLSSLQTAAHAWGAVRGVRTQEGNYIATFGSTGSAGTSDSESPASAIKVWDVRRFDRAVSTATVAKGQLRAGVAQIEWGERRGVLRYIHAGESVIRGFAMSDGPKNEDGFTEVTSRSLQDEISAFSLYQATGRLAVGSIENTDVRLRFLHLKRPHLARWLNVENKIISVTNDLSLIEASKQSANREAPSAHACVTALKSVSVEEDLMITKARSGYGVIASTNMEIASSDETVRHLWEWVARGGHATFVDPTAASSRKSTLVLPGYTSAPRQLAIRMCGWGGAHSPIAPRTGDWEHLVALCILDQRDMKRAIQILSNVTHAAALKEERSINDFLALAVSAALSGWPGTKEPEESTPTIQHSSSAGSSVGPGWTTSTSANPVPVLTAPPPPSSTSVSSPSPVIMLETRSPSRLAMDDEPGEDASKSQAWCESVLELTKNVGSFLRLALEVLVAASGGTPSAKSRVEDVVAKALAHPNISSQFSFMDRVALACNFVSDDVLRSIVEIEVRNAIAGADLQGLILTNISTPLGKAIMRAALNRVDKSHLSDVALLSALHQDSQGETKNIWMELYRDWLDHSGMHIVRARLDVALAQLKIAKKPPQPSKETIHVHCAKCGANLILAGNERIKNEPRRFPSHLCATCARTLPVCSVCRSPMDWPSPIGRSLQISTGEVNSGEFNKRRSDFKAWLTWCLDCKHGGHVGCLSEWFALKKVCPVASCSCSTCGHGFS